jgi:DNA-binding response OmpR family regulator
MGTADNAHGIPPSREGELAMSRVLVIEDDLAVAALLRVLLTRSGHTVIAADSGEAGIDCLASGRPELIILDLRLPGTDGFGVLEHVRSQGPSPPVLILTAERDARARALDAGADAFLQKPFDNAELVSTVGDLLTPAM